ncbi:MAG: M48 family metallopeptidase, partial [Clostridiales bacterium]|nr:M48 family metallopeptidase [Clostridiales bacterium]
MAIQIRRNGEVVVRIPHQVSDDVVQKFVAANHDKLLRSLKEIQSLPKQALLSALQIKELKKKALETLPGIAAHYAQLLGVQTKHIKITSAKSRFGSCSSTHGICFS